MSNRYSASIRGAVGPAAGAAFAEFRNGSTRRCEIEEIGVFNAAATLLAVGLARHGAQGAGGAVTLAGLAEDPANTPAATATLAAAAFSTAPTFTAANKLRAAMLPAAIGSGIIWTWSGGDRLVVPASASVVFFNHHSASGSALWDVYATWVE